MEYWFVEDCCDVLDSMRVPITAADRVSGIYPYYGANGIQDHVAEYIFDDELVLLAEDGGNFGSKERPIAYRVSGKCWVNNHAHVLKPRPGLNVDYLCYSLMFYDTSGIVNGATRQKLTQAEMRKMIIPKRPVSDQLEIIQRIQAVEKIIRERKQQLEALDTLIKARFVEMFGTIQHNTYGLAVGTLESVAEEFFAGGDKPSDCLEKKDNEHPYPVYANGYENGGLQGYSAKCRVCKPSVTVSARGTIGYCSIREARYTPVVRLITIVPNDKVSVEYLKYAIDTMNIKSSGTSQAQLTVPDFKKEKIIVPPLNLQGHFAAFVSQVDKSKAVVQKALDEAQLLFDSLMQKYFG